MQEDIKYSIVVATFNRSKSLAEMLTSVFNQTVARSNYEIIIVDDGSTDDTKEVIDSFNVKQPEHKARYFFQKNSGCAKARNMGILNSRGEIIFFTDDDCVVPNNWIEKISNTFKNYPEAVGVGGWAWPAEEILKENKFHQFYYQFFIQESYPGMKDREMYTINKRKTPMGNTSNVAYKKEILMEAGLFDENIYFTGHVDWELKLRIKNMGYPVVYIPFHVLHKKEMTLKEFFLKSVRQGRGRDYCRRKYKELENLPYYNPSISRIMREIRSWYLNKNKRPFLLAYFIHLFAGLCGLYLNRILGFSPKLFDGSNNAKK